jgi:hypothetical protein
MNMTTSLDTLRALTFERIAISKKLAPLNTRMATLRAELSSKQAAVGSADAAVAAAATASGLVEGRVLIGDGTADELEQARTARKGAETARAAAQKALAGVGGLSDELAGLEAAGATLAQRLVALDGIEAVARERYVRDVADEIASAYAEAARALAPKFAAVLAAQQMLARANLEPNLLTGSTEMLLIPAFNTPSARSPSGVLVDFDSARRQQPAAFDTIRERLLADGVTVPGLV